MIELSFYENLPDFLSQKEVEKAFEHLLMKSGCTTDINFLDALCELSSRQVNNYALLKDDLLTKLNQVVCTKWDKDSLENTENCISIIINLGLQKAYLYLKKELPSVTNPKVKKELAETFEEMGTSVENVR